MTSIDFKEETKDFKITKEALIETGSRLQNVKDEVEKLNEKLSEIALEKGYVFDDTVSIGTSYLRDAINLIAEKLGTIQILEAMKRK